jgi:hypothetical protein
MILSAGSAKKEGMGMWVENIARLQEASRVRLEALEKAIEIKEQNPDTFRDLAAWKKAISDQKKAEREIMEINQLRKDELGRGKNIERKHKPMGGIANA